jgi:predicted dehydrogenase
VPHHTTSLSEAVGHPDVDVVTVGLPNHLHLEAIQAAAKSGEGGAVHQAARSHRPDEARQILAVVEEAGVFGGYLEDLVYTPKTVKAVESVRAGAVGDPLWVRSRETHPGPHSAWFFDADQAGGGAIVDLGCHCIEIIRSFVGRATGRSR